MLMKLFVCSMATVIKGFLMLFPDSNVIDMPDAINMTIAGLDKFIDVQALSIIIGLWFTVLGTWAVVIIVNKIINLIRGSG